MRTTGKTGSLAILTVAMGLAVAASGCIIEDSSNPSSGVCLPNLYVNWQVTQVVNNVDTPIACDVAGAASVTGQVGGFTDTEPCPAGATAGPPLFFPLNVADTYSVNVQLRDANGGILSQTGVNMPPPPIYVDCSGNTQTPTLSLSIN